MYQFATHSCGCQPSQRLPLVPFLRRDRDFLDFIHSHCRGPPQPLDNDLRADPLFDMLLYFLEYLACKYNDRRSAVAYFGVLGASYVGQYAGCGMDNFEELIIST